MRHSKINMKKLVSSTFSFLLTLLFFTLFVAFGLCFGVFNNKSIISKVNETSYYNKVYVELNKKAEEIVTQAALPTTVLENVITMERVYVGGNNYINSTLEGKEPQINTDKLKNELSDHIDQYLGEQGIEQTMEVNSVKDKVISRIEQEYLGGVKLQFINYIMELRGDFMNLIKWLIPLLFLLIGTLCGLLFKIHKYKHRSLRYINYALISSSLMMLLATGYLLISKGYEKLNVMPVYYREFLSAYLNWGIKAFLYIGGVVFIIAITLISLTGFLKNRNSDR